jgi:transposase
VAQRQAKSCIIHWGETDNSEAEKDVHARAKIEAIRLLERCGRTQAEIGEEVGTPSSSLSRWKKKEGADGEALFPMQGNLMPEEERIRQLGRENEILRQERDVLHLAWRTVPGKKVVTILWQPSR